VLLIANHIISPHTVTSCKYSRVKVTFSYPLVIGVIREPSLSRPPPTVLLGCTQFRTVITVGKILPSPNPSIYGSFDSSQCGHFRQLFRRLLYRPFARPADLTTSSTPAIAALVGPTMNHSLVRALYALLVGPTYRNFGIIHSSGPTTKTFGILHQLAPN